jgi:glycosyltransferase involved in cell wall biosynthesis
MRVLFTCGREPQYVRNEVILRALRRRYQVTEITDNQPGSLIGRSLRLLPRLVKSVSRDNYDLLFVGFYGYLLIPWLRRLTHRPILFDAFVSNYDTLCFDRQQFQPNSIMGKLTFQLDRLACSMADFVLLDTAAHQQYFVETFKLEPEKLGHLYVSCNESLFHPMQQKKSNERFDILYYSSYLPLHGVEYIIKSAEILKSRQDIQFRLIGDGLSYQTVRAQAYQLGINNVQFIPPIPYHQLPWEIAQANLCLAGPFGNTAKARRVIPGKLFQFLAMARPTIAGDTPANRELLTHRQNSFLLPIADADALASAISEVKEDDTLRQKLATNGYDCYQRVASEKVIGKKLYDLIENIPKR